MSQPPTSSIGPDGALRLPDGRSISFSVAGPDDGFPVLYCHGAIGSPRWRTPALDALIERLSIRYLMVNRPGFGRSDPSPGRAVADFAHDVGELMSSLGHRRFSVVGVSAGAPYALACGWALVERLVGLAAVSPLGPRFGRGASRGLRYQVPLVPFGPHGAGPALARACLRAVGLHGDTPTRAMIDDYLVCRRDWGFDPAELRLPVTVWHGGADRLVPLAHARTLAAAIPGCTARVAPGGGHFFYSASLAEIITSVLPDAPAGHGASRVARRGPRYTADSRRSARSCSAGAP